MIIFRVVRKITMKLIGKKEITPIYEGYVNFSDQSANDLIYGKLIADEPCMISKFGTIELNALVSFKCNKQNKYSLNDYFDYFTGKKPSLWWNIKLDSLCSNAGFFPNDKNLLQKFYTVNESSISNIDILASYIENEKYFNNELSKAKRVNLDGFYAPFLFERPWTKALEGKKVLVIHPFSNDIESQYKKKDSIWEDKDVLPDFEILTYKPVVSMLGNETEYKTWFEALKKMEKDISEIDFDIALVGCGAYGMPLASFIKNQGKKAIHLAGWTQVLFGIKGKRWDEQPRFSVFYNPSWIRPGNGTKPAGFEKIENGCYW